MQGTLCLSVKVQPGARRTEILGFDGEVLRLRVTAPAREGKADQAVVSLLVEGFHIPKSSIQLILGQRSKQKVFAIEGLSLDEVKSRVSGK